VATDVELAAPPAGRDVRGAAVLLHPHPHFGGDRFHPLVDTLFRLLPPLGYGAVRFDFASADPSTAQSAAEDAVTAAHDRFGSSCPVAVVGYSFGAGVAAHVADADAWVLVAPQAGPITDAPAGRATGPKLVLLAERDQFSPVEDVEAVVSAWSATTVEVLAGDHFLATTLGTIVERIADWLPANLRLRPA
jgi:alpha/beta superfamily hydrolase